MTPRGDLAHHLDELEEELSALEERDPVDLDEWHEEAAESLRHDTEIEAHVLGVLVDIEAADAVAELAPDEVCPCCDGNGWLETPEGHQIACELCDERGLVAIDATYHAHEEAYESLDAAIAAACEVAS